MFVLTSVYLIELGDPPNPQVYKFPSRVSPSSNTPAPNLAQVRSRCASLGTSAAQTPARRTSPNSRTSEEERPLPKHLRCFQKPFRGASGCSASGVGFRDARCGRDEDVKRVTAISVAPVRNIQVKGMTNEEHVSRCHCSLKLKLGCHQESLRVFSLFA